MGTRHINVKKAKQNVIDVFSKINFLAKRPLASYWFGYFFIIIRAFLGPIMEYVHVGVDINNYVKLIDCNDTVRGEGTDCIMTSIYSATST